MSPVRSFLLLLIFMACFIGLHYVKSLERYFPSVEEFIPDSFYEVFTKKHERYPLPEVHVLSDTLFKNAYTEADTITDAVFVIPDSLYSPDRQVRIMYYGDSQIEGDRISSYLRRNLQKRFSGRGPGLFLHVMPVMYTNSIVITSSSNWERYTYLSYRKKEISHNDFGPMMAVCRYLPEGVVEANPVTASVTIKPSVFADSLSSCYDNVRIFYRNPEGEVVLSVKTGNIRIGEVILDKTATVSEVSCALNLVKEVTLEFSGTVSPDILGISIESATGVIVDNVPQRGSAGLEFTMIDYESLAESYKLLAPNLFILQYGLNVVSNISNDYLYYQRGLERQITQLKKTAPSAIILVVGVTDVASGEIDNVRTSQKIPAIIKAQQAAAKATGAFFWNSFEAMGGDSSIIRWAAHNPPLAQKDYVHFTSAGANEFANILLEAMFVYDKETPFLQQDSAIIITHVTDTNMFTFAQTSFINDLIKYDINKPMIFSSLVFWLFLTFVLAGYAFLYRKKKIRSLYLLIVSLFFYYKSGGLFLFLLVFVTLIDYSCGLLIHRSERKAARRFFIGLSIFSNFGILAYFKYTALIVDVVNNIFGTDFQTYDYLASLSNSLFGLNFDVSAIILPVGISFFIFQSLSYTIDVYRKKIEPVRSIIDFGFFVSFFPQLVAGPIVRASEFIPQLYADFRLTQKEYGHALFLICKGLIKKIIISDFIAVNFVDRVFDAPTLYSGFENLMAVYGYGLQIYCDFSGYSDIAIGLGLVFGFRFPVNFNSPYKAPNITDFWKRWHISLSRWLKDYLYISLGGNRKGSLRTYLNLLITMLLGGLWHGAALRFIIWGGLHGFGLVINKLWKSVTGGRVRKNIFGKLIGIIITFNFVNFCWMFFRAQDITSVNTMLYRIFSVFDFDSVIPVIKAYSGVFALIALGYIIHFLPERIKEAYRGMFIKIPVALQFAIILIIASFLYQMRIADVIPFIYFRF